MKIVIKVTNIQLTQALQDLIQKKINDLEKFSEVFGEKYFNRYFGKGKPRVEAWIEIGKETRHHRKGPFFKAECQMRFPGRSLRSEARSKDLKLAIVEVKDELQRQLKQYKEKFIAKTKRAQRVLKKEFHLTPQARLNFEKNLGGQARFYRKGRIREEGV